MSTVYFLYSDEQINEKNKILARANKMFEPGIVTVNGKKMKFTQMSMTSEMPRFVDSKIVASGEQGTFTYTNPKNVSKRG